MWGTLPRASHESDAFMESVSQKSLMSTYAGFIGGQLSKFVA